MKDESFTQQLVQCVLPAGRTKSQNVGKGMVIYMLIIAINLTVLFIFLIAFLLSRINSSEILISINKKEHKLYFFYPLIYCLLSKTPLGDLLKRRNNKESEIRALYTTTRPERLSQLFWCGKLSLVMVTIILFNVLSLFSQLVSISDSVIFQGKYLIRPEYGEGSSQVKLDVTLKQKENSAGSNQKEASKTQKIQIDVDERSYTQKELKEILENAFQYVNSVVLADNKSAEQINTDLNFLSKIPGTAVAVDWIPENTALIERDGRVHNQGIAKEGIATSVTVILTCQNSQSEHSIPLRIMPGNNREEDLINKLNEELLKTSKETATDRLYRLPDTIGTYHLSWSEEQKNSGTILLFLGIILGFVVWIGTDRELDSRMKKRKEQLLLDYPELINKFTLLINAGMTIKQAFHKITEDYCNKSGKELNKRYAYEEMLITVSELKLGVPENIAYEQYGRRIGLISYIKFSSLITQSLNKGTRGFTELLLKEAAEAFEERKETAKRLGEEAGTKLLIPMSVLLIMVFLIIMIPAFMAFRI